MPATVTFWVQVWRYDWIDLWRGRRLPLTAALTGILVALATGAGALWLDAQRQAVAQVIAADDDQHAAYRNAAAAYLDEHGVAGRGAPQSPVSVYWMQAFAWLPPKPEGILAVGQSDVRPYYAAFNGVERQVLHFPEEIRNPLHLLIGTLDLAFVAVYLLPLLAIVLAYDIVSGERDAGRLSLLRVQARSVGRLMLARLALRCILLTLLFSATTTAALIIAEPAALSADLIQFLIVSSVYVAAWFAVVLLVNTLPVPAWLCGLVLAAVWIGSVFLVPTLLHVAIERWHPLPSRTQQVVAAAAFRHEVDSRRPEQLARLLQEQPALMASGDPGRRGDTPDWYPAFIAYQMAIEREEAGGERQFRQVLEARERMAERLRFVAPAVVVQRAAHRIAAVGTGDLIAFADRVETFRADRLEYTRQFIFRNEYLRDEELAAIPRYVPVRAADRRAAWDVTLREVAWLAGMAGCLVLWSRRRLEAS